MYTHIAQQPPLGRSMLGRLSLIVALGFFSLGKYLLSAALAVVIGIVSKTLLGPGTWSNFK